MGPQAPSVDQAVHLIRLAVGVAPIGEGLGGPNLITVALSAAIRTGQSHLVLREALEPTAMPAEAWRRLGSFLECVCLLDSEALVDLAAHPNGNVRQAAWRALEQYGDSRLVEPLRDRLANESPALRLGIDPVLTRLSSRRQGSVVRWPGPLSPDLVTLGNSLAGMPVDHKHLPLLLSLLDGRIAAMRRVAARALLSVGEAGADAVFTRESRRDGPLSEELLWLLGELRDPRGARLIVQRSAGGYVHHGELATLASIGGPAGAEAFIDLIERGHELRLPTTWRADPTITDLLLGAFEERRAFRRRGSSVIAAIGGPLSEQLLVTALQDPHRKVRLEAEAELRNVGTSVAPRLVPLLMDADPSVRCAALRVLEDTATAAEAEAITRVLVDGAREERDLAAGLLAKLGGPPAAKALIASWASLDSDVKLTVIERSARAADPTVGEAVIELAGVDSAASVRRLAGWMFAGWLQDPNRRSRIQKLLLRLLDDPDEGAAEPAVSLLARCGATEIDHFASLIDQAGTAKQRSRLSLVKVRADERRQLLSELAAKERTETEVHYIETEPLQAAATESLLSPELPAPDLPAPVTDRVWFSAVCPEVVLAGSPFVLEIWASLSGERDRVLRPYTRTTEKGPVVVPRGACLNVTLEIIGFGIHGLRDTMQWLGLQGNASFGVNVPATVAPGSYLGTACIQVDHVRITTLHFLVEVGRRKSDARADMTNREERVRTAFASYASEDRERVLARVQGMQAILPDLAIFLDVVSLRMGERWQERLLEEISSRDVFYLFWSEEASRSRWVDWEWRAAAHARGTSFIDPIPLEKIPPPPELSHLHFGHWTLAFTERRHDAGLTPE